MTPKLRLKWELLLPIIRVMQHNCAKPYEWTIAALEWEDKRRVDVAYLQDPLS